MGECQVSLDTSSDSITARRSANNSKSIQIVSWWSVMDVWPSSVPLLLLYSSGPCYLHSCLTSADVFTWDGCNATPWFTDGDNLCFKQGEAATDRGVGFHSAAVDRGGSAWLQSSQLHTHTHPSLSYTLWFSIRSGLCFCLP